MSRHAVVLLALAGIGAALSSPAAPAPQDPQPPQDAPRPEQPAPKLVIEPGEHNLADLLERAARFLRHNYVLSPSELAQLPEPAVTLQNPLSLDARQCEEVIGQLALARDLVRVPLHPELGIYQWVWMQGPHREKLLSRPTRLTPDEVRAHRNEARFVLTAMPLEHVPPSSVVSTLRTLLSANSRPNTAHEVSFGGAGADVLIGGLAGRVAEVLDLVETIDRPQPQIDPGVQQQLEKLEQRIETLEKQGKGEAKQN